jgi:hypothetical protein
MTHSAQANRRRIYLVAFLALIGVGALLLFIQQMNFFAWDFRNNLWGPTHLLVEGRSPYDLAPLNLERGNAAWFPMPIGVFFWLGYLPQVQATNLWWVLMGLALLGSVYLARPVRRPPLLWTACLLLMVALFPPLIAHMSLGQYTLIAMFCLMVSVRLLDDERFLWSGVLLALASAKPQVVLLPVMGICLYIWWYHGWQALFKMLAALVGSALLMTIPLWVSSVSWPLDFLTNLQNNPTWQHPSLYTWLVGLAGRVAPVVYVPLFAGLVLLNAAFWLARSARVALLWSLALNVIAVLYIWNWDFVLLLPLLTFTFLGLSRLRARLLLLLIYIILWGVMVHIQLTTGGATFLFWWVPYALLAGIVAVRWLDGYLS